MRLAPALLLCACGPTAATFQTDYAERYCLAVDELCPPAQLPELCRSIGVAPDQEPVTDCAYDGTAASTCLTGIWRCSDEGEVDPPDACERVWTCPDPEDG